MASIASAFIRILNTHFSRAFQARKSDVKRAYQNECRDNKKMEASTAIHIKTLLKERDQLIREIEALRNKVVGLEIAVNLISGRPSEALPVGNKGRVSETIFSLLRESGEAGLKAKHAVELAASRGITLNSGSVYSLLHRMEREGVVVREDGLYKLREFAGPGDRPANSNGGGTPLTE